MKVRRWMEIRILFGARHAKAPRQLSQEIRLNDFIDLSGLWAAPTLISRFDWAWVPIIALGLLDVVLGRRLGMRFLGWERFSLMITLPAAVAIYYRVSGRSDRLADAGYYMTSWLVFSALGCILTYIAARLDLPLRDIQFGRWDALLSFDWYRWASFVGSHKGFELLLDIAYATILPQTIGSVIYFSHIRRPDRNDDLLRTTMAAAIIATVMSALLPALGPHLKGQYVEWSATLAAVRTGSVSTFSLEHLQGIIAFPSFHAVAAILLMYAHRPTLPSFPVMLILNLMMLLSVPAAGQHYLVDIISGAIVAFISIAGVRLTTRPHALAN
jgi:PAP2 superfamily